MAAMRSRYRHTVCRSPSWGPAAFVALILTMFSAAAAAAAGPGEIHKSATSALSDIRAAIAEIQHSAALTTSGPDQYKKAAQRAVNALVGKDARLYKASAGSSGDAPGALGHLNALLHRRESRAWTPAVHGVWVHVQVAVAQLQQAHRDHDLDEFNGDMSDALQSLEMAIGRRSTGDSIGGLMGALANTELGVPPGARQVSGCSKPTHAPAYGVEKGRLLFVTLPLKNGAVDLPPTVVARGITVKGSYVVVHTPASRDSNALCGGTQKAAQTVSDSQTGASQSDSESDHSEADDDGGHGPPALYTREQALGGKQIFAHSCASCHGADMQGGSAPPNGGTAFLEKAKALDWSVADMQYLVVNSMPMDNPGSLQPEQYAQVLAYLLARDCYPAGSQAFPKDQTKQLSSVELEPPDNVKPDNPKTGTCNLR